MPDPLITHQFSGPDQTTRYQTSGLSTEARTSCARSADVPVNTNWRDRRACTEQDPELFFPIGNTGLALVQIEEAKSVCRRCPVLEPCGQWALQMGEAHGVWGGMSEDDRRRIKRRAARNRNRNRNKAA